MHSECDGGPRIYSTAIGRDTWRRLQTGEGRAAACWCCIPWRSRCSWLWRSSSPSHNGSGAWFSWDFAFSRAAAAYGTRATTTKEMQTATKMCSTACFGDAGFGMRTAIRCGWSLEGLESVFRVLRIKDVDLHHTCDSRPTTFDSIPFYHVPPGAVISSSPHLVYHGVLVIHFRHLTFFDFPRQYLPKRSHLSMFGVSRVKHSNVPTYASRWRLIYGRIGLVTAVRKPGMC